MTRNWIYDDVQRLRKKYGTNDPFELLDAIHAQVVFSDAYPKDGLKGYCAVLLKQKYVVINSKLIQCEKRVVGSHELGHLIVHGDELKTGAAFKDHDIYQATGRKEREANFFAADFLIDDSDVLDAIDGTPIIIKTINLNEDWRTIEGDMMDFLTRIEQIHRQ